MNRLQIVCIVLVWATALYLCGSLAHAIDVSPVFTLDNTQSRVTVNAIFTGASSGDSDNSSLSGTVNSTLTIDPSGGTPLITGLNFTSAHYTADNSPLLLTLPQGPAGLTYVVEGYDIAGTLTTPSPPAPITSGGGGDLSYTFDASNHNTTFNEGNLEFLFGGSPIGSYNLADPGNEIGDPGPASPPGTINLTQVTTAQNLTLFTAQMTFPVDVSDTIPVEGGPPDVDVDITGTVVASGSFLVDIGLASNALLLPGDPIIAIDTDGGSKSSSPLNEESEKAIDGFAGANKYLNFGGANSGFIVTPGGSASVQSMRFSSANDFEERDPATWDLYGTNDAISSPDHSLGTDENWTLIDSGTTDLPIARGTAGPFVEVTNGSSYSSYKILFPTTKNLGDPIMHLGEAEFFTGASGAGTDVLDPADPTLAIDADFLSESTYLNGAIFEGPANAIDGVATTKYANGEGVTGHIGKNSGFIVTPIVGASIIDSFQLTTANDNFTRDPAAWELYGTNEAIVSTDNSLGDGENWTLIDSGTLDPNDVPQARLTVGDVVSVSNSTAYTSYRMIFTDLKDTNEPFMQFGDIQFFGSLATLDNADFNGSGFVDGLDFLIWQRNLGLTSQTTNENGDADGDGVVSTADLTVWKGQYGSPPTLTAALSAVPEPGTLVLGLCLVLTTVLFRPARRVNGARKT